MMVNTASSFIFSIFAFYSFYRYVLNHDAFFKEWAIIHFMWLLFYLSSALAVISRANHLANEVNFKLYKSHSRQTQYFRIFYALF